MTSNQAGELIVNNNDERDYAEETYNQHLLNGETDPEQEYENLAKGIASLNEIVAELAGEISSDREFRDLARDVLRDSSFRLGFSFQGEQPSLPAAWPEQYRENQP